MGLTRTPPETPAASPQALEGATGERSYEALCDRYLLLRPIGRGSMAEVYSARDCISGEMRAVKLLHRELVGIPRVRERFAREAEAMRRFSSPNVVRVVDGGEAHDGTPFFVMELLAGADVRQRLMGGPIAVERCVPWLIQACRGVQCAHEHGLVHRDLKPDNLFIAEGARGEQCKVLDFGVVKVEMLSTLRRGRGLVGTFRYMSPEQARGERVGPPTDVFALGAILFECVTGDFAFEGEEPAAILSRLASAEIRVREPHLPLSSELRGLLAEAMAADPRRRLPTVDRLRRRLEGLSASPSGPPRGRALAASPRPPRPEPRPAGVEPLARGAMSRVEPPSRRAPGSSGSPVVEHCDGGLGGDGGRGDAGRGGARLGRVLDEPGKSPEGNGEPGLGGPGGGRALRGADVASVSPPILPVFASVRAEDQALARISHDLVPRVR